MTSKKFNIGLAVSLAIIFTIAAWYSSINSNITERNDTQTISNSDSINNVNTTQIQSEKTISIEANFINFDNVEKLDAVADLIVVGTAIKSFEDRQHVATYFNDGTLQDFYTLTEIDVSRIIKGTEDLLLDQSSQITIIEPVAYVIINNEKTKLTRDDYIELPKGDASVIFLKKNTYGEYSIINQNLGKFSFNKQFSSQLPPQVRVRYHEFRQSIFQKYGLRDDL